MAAEMSLENEPCCKVGIARRQLDVLDGPQDLAAGLFERLAVSIVTVWESSSNRSRMSPCRRNSSRPRSTAGVSRHAGNAAFAVRTAASISVSVDSGRLAITSPVAGLSTSIRSVLADSTHSPLIQLLSCLTSELMAVYPPATCDVHRL